MNVLHINSYAHAGGAEQVARDLLKNPLVHSHLAVQSSTLDDKRIIELPLLLMDKFFHVLDKLCWKIGFRNTFKVLFGIVESINLTHNKLKWLKAYQEADINHLHNIHNHYFGLNALINIAQEKNIVWTLHDMWAVTGGEFYTYHNLNYQKGIGKTDIKYLYPLQDPLIDRRQHLLQRKKQIYLRIASKITFVPVSDWLEKIFRSSYVFNEQLKVRRIYNGVDTSIFYNKNNRIWLKPRLLFFNSPGESKAAYLFLNILNRIAHAFDLYCWE
jgi:Glycosyltransferase Family 4